MSLGRRVVSRAQKAGERVAHKLRPDKIAVHVPPSPTLVSVKSTPTRQPPRLLVTVPQLSAFGSENCLLSG